MSGGNDLSQDRRGDIVEAALASFAKNGYRKASVKDIAMAAGISKAMVFHYFGSKKALYLHLADLCLETIRQGIDEEFDASVEDFFERIRAVTRIKVRAMKRHPGMIAFLDGMYRERDPEIAPELKQRMAGTGGGSEFRLILDGLDVSGFKEDVDPRLVMKMLSWLSEGYVTTFPVVTESDVDDRVRQYDECLDLLRKHLYKEE